MNYEEKPVYKYKYYCGKFTVTAAPDMFAHVKNDEVIINPDRDNDSLEYAFENEIDCIYNDYDNIGFIMYSTSSDKMMDFMVSCKRELDGLVVLAREEWESLKDESRLISDQINLQKINGEEITIC